MKEKDGSEIERGRERKRKGEEEEEVYTESWEQKRDELLFYSHSSEL